MTHSGRIAIGTAAAAAMLLGACGGSASHVSTASPTVPSATVSPGTTPVLPATTTPAAPDTGGATSGPGPSPFGAGSGGGGSTSIPTLATGSGTATTDAASSATTAPITTTPSSGNTTATTTPSSTTTATTATTAPATTTPTTLSPAQERWNSWVAAVGDPAQAAINVDLGKIAAAQSYLAQTGMVDRLRGWGNQLTVDADDALNAENPPVPSIVAPWVAWLKALRTLGTEAKAGSLTLTAEQAVKSTTTALRNAVTTAGF